MWTLLVMTIINVNGKNVETIYTEFYNIKSREHCVQLRKEWESKNPYNVGVCEKQPGNEPIKVRRAKTKAIFA